MSIIDTWLAARKAAGIETATEIREELNKATGLHVLNNRLYEWRIGEVRPSYVAVNYMTRVSLRYAMAQVKPGVEFSDKEIKKLAAMLAVPEQRLEKK